MTDMGKISCIGFNGQYKLFVSPHGEEMFLDIEGIPYEK